MMGRTFNPMTGQRPSPMTSKTISGPSFSSSSPSQTRQLSTMSRVNSNTVIDLTMSPPLPSATLQYSLTGEPQHYRNGSSTLQSGPTKGAPQRQIMIDRVASAPSSTAFASPTPSYHHSAAPTPVPSTPGSTFTSPTSIIPPSLPYGIPTWNTPSTSSQPNQKAYTFNPPIPKPIRRMPKGCKELMLDVPSYPSRPGFNEFHGPANNVKFDMLEDGFKELSGISMRDALSGTGLKNPLERVFTERFKEGKMDFTFVLRWPGYSGIDWRTTISIVDSNMEPITREELAFNIARVYHNFVCLCGLDRNFCRPNQLSWRISDGGYTFDRMRLININRADDDVWVADVCVIADEGYRGFGVLRDITQLEY